MEKNAESFSSVDTIISIQEEKEVHDSKCSTSHLENNCTFTDETGAAISSFNQCKSHCSI